MSKEIKTSNDKFLAKMQKHYPESVTPDSDYGRCVMTRRNDSPGKDCVCSDCVDLLSDSVMAQRRSNNREIAIRLAGREDGGGSDWEPEPVTRVTLPMFLDQALRDT